MAAVSKPRGGQKETSNTYLVLAVKILLVLLILFLLPKLVQGKRQGKYNARLLKQRSRGRLSRADLYSTRMACEMEVCVNMIPEESMNCVQLCISPACYQEAYGEEPLEDGELDIDHALKFEECAQEEMRLARKRRIDAKKQGIPLY